MNRYVLITPAHNEQEFIEKAIDSVVKQAIRPERWVIVNDGSNDRTAEIVETYCRQYDFIELVDVQRDRGRSFGNKATAFNRGLERVKDMPWEFIGNLDADISIPADYYRNIIRELNADLELGIAGGIVFTKIGSEFVTDDTTLDSVAGAIQLFRRECFDAIGSYVPLPFGGIDAAAEIKARMRGWKVKKFRDNPVYENRRTGSGTGKPLAYRVYEGRRFHSLGYDPFFYLVRCLYRLADRPWILGSTAALGGYFMSAVCRRPVMLPREAVDYLRAEQRGKLKALLVRNRRER